MRRRRLYLILAVILLLGVLAYALFRPEREPSYNGRSLTQWLDAYPMPGPADYAQRKAAYLNAFSEMGTNAVPHLVKWVKRETPPWKSALIASLRTNLPSWNLKLRLVAKLTAADRRGWSAANAFEALGPRAEFAIDELRPLLTHKTDNSYNAALALVHIGPQGLANILSAVTNPLVYRPQNMIFAISTIGTNAMPVVPRLVQLLQSTNIFVALSSAAALGRLQLQPEIVVPALQAALKDSRTEIRHVAIDSLDNFRTNARSAVPALRELLDDPDRAFRRKVTNALRQIAPESLAK